jgi:hypothetical protein
MAQAEKRLYAIADLWHIAETNDTRALRTVLSSGLDVDARNEHGTTALMRAACHGKLQMVEALLMHGADPNAVRNDDFTALTLAAFFGHTEVVRLLVQAGADTDRVTRNGTSARMWASARTFKSVAKYLDELPPLKPVVKDKLIRAVAPAAIVEPAAVEVIEGDEVSDIGPEIEEGTERPALTTVFSRRLSLRVIAAFTLVIAMISIAAIALFSRNGRGKDIRAPAPVTQAVSKSDMVNVGPVHVVAAESKVERPSSGSLATARKTLERKALPAGPKTSRSSSTKSARHGEDLELRSAPKRAVKPDVAEASVATPVSTSKPVVSPLSTQLVSPSLKAGSKPKVIQWP